MDIVYYTFLVTLLLARSPLGIRTALLPTTCGAIVVRIAYMSTSSRPTTLLGIWGICG